MPQTTKASRGGKTQSTKSKSRSSGAVSEKAAAKKASRSNGPTGPNKHGEKKSTPH
ncbi:hypothetical protein [Ramlibacter sp. Leaf400]|uniref:hypothetical protein n=1 Tax=Ramlibacter sp. Leaf400 TaxID=1736365 RepID=UPI0012E37AC3|nr:hypothetical protein [Ramlibacter sp. Leaf400]